ncbi:MAG: ATP-binding protein [Pseudomonadota bacterium]
MYGLRRIIQIDGFIPGIRTVVELDGHSIINGTNGAGKSSTLKLLSFFYGSDPSQLDSHAAGRDPFVLFYLPRQTSLLVFEYARESGLCSAVAYRHKSGTKHVYRFLEGGFTEERFSQKDSSGKAVYCKGHDLKMHWRQLSLTCSQQIEVVTDYRAIIQNDSALINRLADSKSLRRLASSYCLGSRKTHMRYIDRICAAIISRSSNMERMKDMLADIMVEDGVVFPESPIHRADASLAKEIGSLREFEKEIPRMKEVLRRHNERLDVDERLNSYGGQLKYAEADLSEEVDKKKKSLDALHAQLNDLTSDWESQYEKLNRRIIETRNIVSSREDKIDLLDEQYAAYEKQDMDQKASDLDNLGRFMANQSVVQSRYTDLNEDVKAEENDLNRQLNAEHQRFERERYSAQKKLDEEREAQHIKERQQNDMRESLSSREQAEKEATREKARPAREELRDAKANAQALASSGGPTEEERTSLAIIQDRIEKLDRGVEKSRQIFEEKRLALQTAKVQRDEVNTNLSRAKRSLENESDTQDELHKLAFAEDGTWLKKLRDSDSGWVMRLGKVVNPDLLQRKDLQAEHVGDDVETVFGWSLNLNAIATPQYAESEEQLRADYATQEEAFQRARDEVGKREFACEKANRRYKAAEGEANHAQLALSQAASQKEGAQKHYQDRNRAINDAVVERRREAKKEAERLKKEIEVFQNALQDRLVSIESRYAEERSEMLGAWAIEQSRMDDSIGRLGQDLEDITATHNCRLIEIQEDFKKVCSEKGIDSATLEAARTDLERAKEKVKAIEDSAGAVSAYREWLKAEWRNRKSLIAALGDFKAQRDKSEEKANEEEREFKRQKEAINKAKTGENHRLLELNKQMGQINILRPRFGFYVKDAKATNPSMPFDLLIREIETLLDTRDALKEKLVDDIQSINSKIGQYGETQIAQAWQRAKDNLRHQLGFDDPFDRNFLINLPQALEVFIDEEVKSIKSARIESLRGIGKGLTDFFEKLRVIHNRIKDQSRKITVAISENMKIDALSSMGLLLTSRVETLDYWKLLQDFSKSWQEWRETGESGLPDQQFLDEMSALISALQTIKSGHHLRDYFDLHIRMVENGHERIIKNDHQLDNSTSDGLKYLALCVIFIAISRQLCPDKDVKLHWPIDELGILHGENISRLFGMLNQGGIVMVGGFPSEDPVMLRHFKHRQVIDFKRGIRVIDIPKSSLKERALARRSMEVGSERLN